MPLRRIDALTLTLLLLIAASLLSGLNRLPALTSDEAWVGLYAYRLGSQGLITPHEMNTYTGPLFGLILSRILDWLGHSVGTLRLFGAVANAVAGTILVLHIRKRIDAAAATWTAVLLASSAYWLLKSRLAWEVYAFQPLLLTLTLTLLDRPLTFWRSLCYCALTLIGIQNHFIYLSVPVSLVVLYSLRIAWLNEEESRPWLRTALASLAAGAIVFIIKPLLHESNWPIDRHWAIPVFIALAPMAALASPLMHWEVALIDGLRKPPVKIWSQRLITISLVAFFVWHLIPLWQVISGVVVWKRVFSWTAPRALQLVLGLWSLYLLVTLHWQALRAWFAEKKTSAHERTLALWPLAYACGFIAFRNTSSLRYYSLIQFLCLVALGPALSRLNPLDKRTVKIFASTALIITQFVFWRELRHPDDRRPQNFKIGWHMENSRDFSRKEKLFSAFNDSHACRIAHQERSFVAIPLNFHRGPSPQPCDEQLAFDAEQCPDCLQAPYYRWRTLDARKSRTFVGQ
jgi:hypothetical protein